MSKKPDKEKHKDIRVPDEDIKLDKSDSFKKAVEKLSSDKPRK